MERPVLDRKLDSQTFRNYYNTYIRDFFADNHGKTSEDAIKCRHYKKQMQGHNRYDKADLIAPE